MGVLGGQLLELGQQLALALGQALRGLHHDLDIHVAGLLRAEHRHTLVLQPEAPARLGTPGTLTRVLPPSMVGTSNSPPSAAVTMEIGTRQCRSAPSRWKNGCAASDRKI